jgi:hypothetical protein
VDAHVASALCVGGVVKYEPIEGSNVTDHFLVHDFVPHLAQKLGNRTALVLGKALLWCLMEPTTMFMVPKSLRVRLRMRYLAIQTLDEVINPIEKIQISIYSVGGQLQIDPVIKRNPTGNDGEEATTIVVAPPPEAQQALLAQQHALRSRVEEIYTTIRNQNDDMMQRIQTLHRVVARIGNRPAQINRGFVGRQNNNDNDDRDAGVVPLDNRPIQYESTLSANPKDLYTLWEEYEFGIEGRKAARKFSSKERGRVKYKYHRRKVVWDLVAELIRGGHTYLTAIDSILDKYGRESTVTSIINKLRSQRAQERRTAAA